MVLKRAGLSSGWSFTRGSSSAELHGLTSHQLYEYIEVTVVKNMFVCVYLSHFSLFLSLFLLLLLFLFMPTYTIITYYNDVLFEYVSLQK